MLALGGKLLYSAYALYSVCPKHFFFLHFAQIHSEAISTSDAANVTFWLDASVGRHTVITINGDITDVKLISPHGQDVLTDNKAQLIKDASLQTAQIAVNGETEVNL